MEEIHFNSKSILDIEREFANELRDNMDFSDILKAVEFTRGDSFNSTNDCDQKNSKGDEIVQKRKTTIGDLLPKIKPIKKSCYKKQKAISKPLSVKSSMEPKEGGIAFSHYKRKVCRKWNEEETERFYKCLRVFGTDFSLISQAMANRDRKEIKVCPF